jgi:hypothetical protein
MYYGKELKWIHIMGSEALSTTSRGLIVVVLSRQMLQG